jgi:DNA-binding response OmpR family regulator
MSHLSLVGADAARKRVLIVEDDPIIARVLADYLTAKGYATSVATTGSDGITQFESTQPDLTIIDVLLPKKNGFEVCFAIRRSDTGKHAPVLLMSAAYPDRDQAEQMRAALSADGFLLKPFELDELLSNVKRVLGEPRGNTPQPGA